MRNLIEEKRTSTSLSKNLMNVVENITLLYTSEGSGRYFMENTLSKLG